MAACSMVSANGALAFDFENDDLFLLSDAILTAMNTNNLSARLTRCRAATEALDAENSRLAVLNRMICNMIQHEEED